MKFVLLNESKVSDAAHGGHLTPAILGKIAAASTTYLNEYVAAYWGGVGKYAVRAGGGKTDVQPGEIVCAIVDALPDAPGAVAYHDVTGKEVPVDEKVVPHFRTGRVMHERLNRSRPRPRRP